MVAAALYTNRTVPVPADSQQSIHVPKDLAPLSHFHSCSVPEARNIDALHVRRGPNTHAADTAFAEPLSPVEEEDTANVAWQESDLGAGSGSSFRSTEHETAVHIDAGLKNTDCLPTVIVTVAAHTWPVAAGVVADRLPRFSQAPTWQPS